MGGEGGGGLIGSGEAGGGERAEADLAAAVMAEMTRAAAAARLAVGWTVVVRSSSRIVSVDERYVSCSSFRGYLRKGRTLMPSAAKARAELSLPDSKGTKDWCDRCAHAAAARASSLWVRVSRQAEARSLSDLLEGNGSASAWASGLRAHCRCSSERERVRGTCTGERAGGRLRASGRAGELSEHGQWRAFAEFSAPSFCNVLALFYLKCDEPGRPPLSLFSRRVLVARNAPLELPPQYVRLSTSNVVAARHADSREFANRSMAGYKRSNRARTQTQARFAENRRGNGGLTDTCRRLSVKRLTVSIASPLSVSLFTELYMYQASISPLFVLIKKWPECRNNS